MILLLKIFCPKCGKICEEARRPVSCACGSPLKSSLDWTSFDIDSGAAGMMRYAKLLPRVDTSITMGEGWTPLVSGGSKNLYYKLEYISPTGSFKDRGAIVVMGEARSLGCDAVVQDSSGNAGASIAAYAARGGVKATVVVPGDTSEFKKRQIEIYGATLIVADGGRSRAASIAMEMAQSTFYASHVWNPFFMEGTRTIAFEIWEQLGGKAPDVVIVPAGNGTMLLGVFKGFKELLQRVKIKKLPRIIAVQGTACAPLFAAWNGSQAGTLQAVVTEGAAASKLAGTEKKPDAVRVTRRKTAPVSDGAIPAKQKRLALKDEPLVEEKNCAPLFEAWNCSPAVTLNGTVAEGIAIDAPPRMKEMLDALRFSRGGVVLVSDSAILAEQKRLAAEGGLLVEPTAAAAPAAERMLRETGEITERDVVVVPLTGTGLKKLQKMHE